MKKSAFILLVFLIASCNSFNRMKYRHLNKVPATPPVFSVQERLAESALTNEINCIPENEVTGLSSAISGEADAIGLPVAKNILPAPTDSCAIESARTKLTVKKSFSFPLKRDWSLLIGTLFVCGGLLALYFCAFVFPFSGINLLLIIFFELFLLYAAWRLITTGVAYFRARFSRNHNYKEG